MIKVTRVVIDEYTPKEEGICAECSIVLNKCIMIHWIKVLRSKDGEYFITMPHTGEMHVTKEGKKRFDDIVHPLTTATADMIKKEVLKKYFSYAKDNEKDSE